MKKPKVLIVDDHDGFRSSLLDNILLNKKFVLYGASDADSALQIVNNSPDFDCVLLDYDLDNLKNNNKLNGIDVLQILTEKFPYIPVIMMSGISESRGQVGAESVLNNAIAFLDKPFPIKVLVEKLDKVSGKKANIDELEIQELFNQYGFYSSSNIMAKLCSQTYYAAKTDLNLMILGETGTGKTLLANAIHKVSDRNNFPFKELNCGTMSSDINWLRSELFGHTANSFNNAKERNGLLSEVQHGTMLLDDITELPLQVQGGLLQVIQSRIFRKLGDNTDREFKARIISTTNQNINRAIKENKFRDDLRFRLCQETIVIPPLKERPEDIQIISEMYLKNSEESYLNAREISREAISLLQRQPWPGNTRQLVYVLKRASTYQKGDVIEIDTIKRELIKEYGLEFSNNGKNLIQFYEEDLELKISEIRRDIIIKTLEKTNGNVSNTARELGYKSHQNLQYWLKEYQINPKEFR